MAELVFIEGESGSGKSSSLRNFEKSDVLVLNAIGKRLPFKKDLNVVSLRKYEYIDAYNVIKEYIKKFQDKCKCFVIDDIGMEMSFEYFDTNVVGYDKFNNIGKHFKNLIDFIQREVADDVIVYMVMHLEMKDDGKLGAKTVGKLLDEKLKLEAMVSVVITTYVENGKYYFKVHGDGTDCTKTPMGMFEGDLVDNDLKEVDKTIREYWGMPQLAKKKTSKAKPKKEGEE